MSITRCARCDAILRAHFTCCIACGANVPAVEKMPTDGELRKRGLMQGLERSMRATEMEARALGIGRDHMLTKRSPHAVGINPEGRSKITIGDVDAGPELGRIFVEHDQSADVVHLHGHAVHLTEIRRDLREAFVAGSAALAAAITSESQAGQRMLIGALVERIAREHPAIGTKLKEIKQNERFTAV